MLAAVSVVDVADDTGVAAAVSAGVAVVAVVVAVGAVAVSGPAEHPLPAAGAPGVVVAAAGVLAAVHLGVG